MSIKSEFPQLDLNPPEIAKGTVVPYGVQRLAELEESRKRAEKKAKLYFWGGILSSILCMIGGYLLGKFC